MKAIELRPNKFKLSEQIKYDLNLFKKVKKITSDYALGLFFESNSNISERAVRRALTNDNYVPQYSNIVEIYSVIYSTRKLDELIDLVPLEIAEYLASKSLVNDLAKVPDSNMAVNNYVLNDPLALKVYLLTSGHGIHLLDLIKKIGDEGAKETFKMAKKEIVNISADQIVKRGKYSLVFNSETIRDVSKNLINSFYRPEASENKSENRISVRISSVSQSAYEKILEEMAIMNEKINIIIKNDDHQKKPEEQTVKMFSSNVIDKIS